MQQRLDPAMLAPVLTGGMRARYLVLTGLWAACVAWFWLWWTPPMWPAPRAMRCRRWPWVGFMACNFISWRCFSAQSAAQHPRQNRGISASR